MTVTSPQMPPGGPQANSLALMPDAFASTFEHHDKASLSRGNLYRKRAEVLATVRRLLARDGLAKFSMRKLAAECRISRQTLHNMAGGRMEIIAEAICDHKVMMHTYVARRYQGEDYFVALTEHLIEVIRKTPEYVRQTIVAYFAFDLPVFTAVNKVSLRLNMEELSAMQRDGSFRNDIDLTALNSRIVELHTACILSWANGMIPFERFEFDMRMGCELLLFGALERPEKQELKRRPLS